MATSKQVQEWRALRGRLLNALWDEENAGRRPVPVSDLLDAIGPCVVSDHKIERLVRDISYDGLISGLNGVGAVENEEIWLTTDGRCEVEQWLAEPDRPTQHLPMPANQVFHIGTMNVTGPVLQGSAATNITTNYGVSSDALVKVVANSGRS